MEKMKERGGRWLLAAGIALLVLLAVAFATKAPYANAFFLRMRELNVTFLVFFGVEAARWLIRLLEEDTDPTCGQEIGWTAALLLAMAFWLYRFWRYYSLWQVCVTVTVMILMLVGLLLRFWGRWNADSIRWGTWAACCLAVTLAIVGSIWFFDPMTCEDARELVAIEMEDDTIEFDEIIDSKSTEAPLGYYMFRKRQEDGSLGGSGRGRAVLYLGEDRDNWRKPHPVE